MGKQRTVVFAVAARGELLDVARAAVGAVGNLLCLSMPPEEGLPRLGICSLSMSPTTGKAQLQVRLRPGDLNLRDFHAAALKLGHQAGPPGEALDGSAVALALQSLAGMLLQDAGSRASVKSIALITDRLPSLDDFGTYLEMAAAKGVGLDVVLLGEGEAGAAAAAAANADWAAVEAARPGLLRVAVVEVAGKAATAAAARELLRCCSSEAAAAPGAVTLDFGAPLLGSLRALRLEAHPMVRPLALGASHAALCACHGAPVALRAPAAGAATPLALARRLRCPVTGAELDLKAGCVQDGKVVCLGDSPAAVIHLGTPLSLSPAAAGSGGGTSANGGPEPAVLRVMHRIPLSSANASFLVGPAVLLTASVSTNGGAAVALEGQAMEVLSQQVLELVVAGLEAKGEGLLCSSAWDVGAGGRARSGLFRRHYLLMPSAPPGEQEGEGASLIAFRVAAVEELEARRRAVPSEGVPPPPPPPAVAAAVAAGLESLQLGSYIPLDCSCRVHEVVDMLCCESKPAPKPTATAAAAVTGAAPGEGGGRGTESGRCAGGNGQQRQPTGRGRGTVRRQ